VLARSHHDDGENSDGQVLGSVLDMLHGRCQIGRPIGYVRRKNIVGHAVDYASDQVFSQVHHVDRKHVAAAGYLYLDVAPPVVLRLVQPMPPT
jgi:hypothetical protein